MSIINVEDLEASPLADLHAIASALGIDGFRGLRKPDLAEAIVARQGGGGGASAGAAPAADDAPSRSGRPPRRRRSRPRDGESGENGAAPVAAASAVPAPSAAPVVVDGVVELLANGSGFVRPDGAENSDSDVYVSAAQARRCELVAGDRISGPVRPARRSERHPSLIRIDTINGVAADEAVHGTRIDDIEVDWPSERIALGSDDAILAEIERVAPFGHGSRVLISGPSRSGKTLVLGRLAAALASIEGLDVELVAVGVRPEELSEYKTLAYTSEGGQTFAASSDARGSLVEQAVERGRRIALRGGNAILLIDTLDGLGALAARHALAGARNLRSAGSLTIIATASEPLGGETTVIALAPSRVPGSLDPERSGTLRSELIVAAKPKRAPAKPKAAAARAPRKRAAPAAKKPASEAT
ncbi:MAG: Rho termination factor N-terminal domain-containing protein [Solirubrobacteraceae bacterium]|jgi:transcription termination factor Rho